MIFNRYWIACCLAYLIMLISFSHSHAEITTDGTLGPAQSLLGPQYNIPAEIGTQKGGNLFHSFGIFNVNTGEMATFTGPSSITNIIGRVTGGNASWIDGILASDISGANLWLLNPFGIIFGKNAKLNVTGAFHASTANYLKLSDGGVFYTDPSQTSSLKAAPPSAFGFLGDNPQKIEIFGSWLRVDEGQTLSLLGGDINIANGILEAPSGTINLVSLASKGEVILNNDEISIGGMPKYGAITISSPATSDYSARDAYMLRERFADWAILDKLKDKILPESEILTDIYPVICENIDRRLIDNSSSVISVSGNEQEGTPSGRIDIFCRDMKISDSSIKAFSYSNQDNSEDLRIFAKNEVSFSDSYLWFRNCADGKGGNLSIEADTILLENGSQIICGNFYKTSRGKTGDIDLTASTLKITGVNINTDVRSGISLTVYGSGDGGNFNIRTEHLVVDAGGFLGVYTQRGSKGNGGNLSITAQTVELDGVQRDSFGTATAPSGIFAYTGGHGNSGMLNLTTEDLAIRNGAVVQCGVFTGGSGNGADATIHANNIHVDGVALNPDGSVAGYSAITTDAMAGSSGNAGSLNIESDRIQVTNGAKIAANTQGQGNGGSIDISSDRIEIDGCIIDKAGALHISQLGAFTWTKGNAGQISIHSREVSISNGGSIITSTTDKGHAGSITINADDLTIDGYISDSSGNLLTISGIESASTTEDSGNAGQIAIQASNMNLLNGAAIQAQNFGKGNGGSIELDVNSIHIVGGVIDQADGAFYASKISAASFGQGDAGNIDIRCGDLTVAQGGRILSNTSGSGRGGKISVASDTFVEISASGKNRGGLFSTTTETGSAGSIEITTPSLILTDSGEISTSTSGVGKAGSISVKTGSLLMNSGAVMASSSIGSGDAGSIGVQAAENIHIDDAVITVDARQSSAGDIDIHTAAMDMRNGSQVAASVLGGSGKGGSVKLDVDTLTLTDGSRVESNTSGSGPGGSIQINAHTSVSISGMGDEPSGLFSTSTGAGKAGFIAVKTPALTLSKSGEISTLASGSGNAGSIGIDVDNLTLKDNSDISSASTGTANAGNIDISVVSRLESRNSTITTESVNADGGDITITTGFLTWLINSAVTATVDGGTETTGGNVQINSPYVVLKDSQVIANAYEGKGGRIDITAGTYLADWTSTVSASSTKGISGEVNINAPLTNLSGLLTPLSESLMDIAELLKDDCETRYKQGKVSSLIVRGQELIPMQTDDLLPSPVPIR